MAVYSVFPSSCRIIYIVEGVLQPLSLTFHTLWQYVQSDSFSNYHCDHQVLKNLVKQIDIPESHKESKMMTFVLNFEQISFAGIAAPSWERPGIASIIFPMESIA